MLSNQIINVSVSVDLEIRLLCYITWEDAKGYSRPPQYTFSRAVSSSLALSEVSRCCSLWCKENEEEVKLCSLVCVSSSQVKFIYRAHLKKQTGVEML